MILPTLKIGNPLLREVAKEIRPSEIKSKEIQDLIRELIETRGAENGAGLAGPQIGVSLQVMVVENDNNPRYPYKPKIPRVVVVNPKISFLTDERFENYEGCLSVPDLRGKVERCPEIELSGFDQNGDPLVSVIKGITAGTFQHEVDHLNGILFVDRVENKNSLCSWDEFKLHHEADFIKQVGTLVKRYGS